MQLRLILRIAALATFLISLQPFAAAHQAATNAAQPGHLTVDRIYSQPSLSGRLTRGIAWSPDGKRLTYLDAKGSGKDAKTELWSLYAASGERSVLISADKLENIFPAPPSKQSQATGAGRHAPSQYQWSPNGEALLFEGTNAVAWFDLKSQSGRVLVSGKEDLSDIKISPDSKYVSFVRDHNLWIVSTADGKERAVTTGGSEVLRKGKSTGSIPKSWTSIPVTGGRRILLPSLISKWMKAKFRNFPCSTSNPTPVKPSSSAIPSPAARIPPFAFSLPRSAAVNPA